MTAYLLERGLDEHDVVTEDRATSTEENLLFSRDLLEERGVTGHLRVITSGYHAGRAALIARRLGLDADVSGARTAWYFVPSAFRASSPRCSPTTRGSTLSDWRCGRA